MLVNSDGEEDPLLAMSKLISDDEEEDNNDDEVRDAMRGF